MTTARVVARGPLARPTFRAASTDARGVLSSTSSLVGGCAQLRVSLVNHLVTRVNAAEQIAPALVSLSIY